MNFIISRLDNLGKTESYYVNYDKFAVLFSDVSMANVSRWSLSNLFGFNPLFVFEFARRKRKNLCECECPFLTPKIFHSLEEDLRINMKNRSDISVHFGSFANFFNDQTTRIQLSMRCLRQPSKILGGLAAKFIRRENVQLLREKARNKQTKIPRK